MTNVTNSTRVRAPNIQALDFHSHTTVRINDAISLNPSGRDIADRNRNKGKLKLLNFKKDFTISLMNVRTIRKKSKQEELISHFNKYKIDILGITDHKIVHDDPVEYHEKENSTLITTSATRNANNTPIGGIGLLLNRTSSASLAEIKPYNSRILVVHFNGNPATTIIVHYAPVQGDEDAIYHYEQLSDITRTIPKHNVLLVIGDCNAHLSPEDALYTFQDKTNDNGKLLLDCSIQANLIIANTRFQKKRGKLSTFMSEMNNRKPQIDYILINSKWKNSLRNCQAYSSFASVGSDHRILSAKLRLSLRSKAVTPRKENYDWSLLKSDQVLQNRYSIQLHNRFSILQNELTDTIDDKYQHLITANKETAKEMLPKKAKRQKMKYSDDKRIKQARKNVATAYSCYTRNPTNETQEELNQKKGALEEVYSIVFGEELDQKVTQIEQSNRTNKHQGSWKLMNEITGRKTAKRAILKGRNKKERVKNWHGYFKELLGKPPKIINENQNINNVLDENELNIKTGPFTNSEYENVRKQIKENKAAGPDGISPEVLKRCEINDIIIGFANKIIINHEKPTQLGESDMIPIPKKGDLSLPSNHRGISLSSIVTKVINRMILNRIQPKT